MASRRDKLQCYLDTLVALTVDGPIKVSMLSLKTRINHSPLKAILVDLERQKLVEVGFEYHMEIEGHKLLRRKKAYNGLSW